MAESFPPFQKCCCGKQSELSIAAFFCFSKEISHSEGCFITLQTSFDALRHDA